jgi:4-hydroxybenzoate polyprenyltransferase
VSEPAAAPVSPPSATRAKGIGGTVRVFLELVKFEHSIFALPYAYIGAIFGAAIVAASAPGTAFQRANSALETPWVTAGGWPTPAALFWVTVAMVGARSFAFVVNRAVDKEIDARNPRTAGRAVPAGLVKAWELWVFSAIVLAAYLFAAFQLAPICRYLSPIPLLAFLVYPYVKRFSPLCHYWLGLCLGLAVPGGWAAVGAPLSNPAPWVLGVAVAIWTAGFDIIYATQDIETDLRDGVHSMPADFGLAPALLQVRIDHALAFVLFVGGGWLLGVSWPYYLGCVIAGILLVYENAIISPSDLSRVNAAFFTVNGFVAVVILLGAIAERILA